MPLKVPIPIPKVDRPWWADRLLQMLRDRDTEPTELGIALTALVWGSWLLLPLQSFAYASFSVLRSLAREEVWGVAAFLLGLWSLISILADEQSNRRVGMAGVAILWGALAGGALSANLEPPAWLIYLMLTAAAMWSYWRLGRRGAER